MTAWFTKRSGRLTDLPRWGIWWGPWWAVLYHRDGTLSLGIHIDPRRRQRGIPPHYGPYVDLHLPMLCLSFGRNPVYCSSLERQRQYAKGKLDGDCS
jgi:hypothetical protein